MAATTPDNAYDNGTAARRPSFFAVPAPVRRLFAHFPLREYPPEPLPFRAPDADARRRPRLYVFASDTDALNARPSFNPSCLKWQAFLRMAGVDVDIVPSNNHASPSGALPFLLPPSSPSSSQPSVPLTGSKIQRFAQAHASAPIPEPTSCRLEAYQALLAQIVRPAWLHALYLNETNRPLLATLYLPSSLLLSASMSFSLRAAAASEVLSTTRQSIICPARLRSDFLTALRALSTLLGTHDWFFGCAAPTLFDAEAFAYTHLILDEDFGWRDAWLADCVREFPNLVKHRARLYERCWAR